MSGQEPLAPREPARRELSPVHVPAVVVGLVLLAVAGHVALRELTGTVLDWRWLTAGVLLVSGAAVVLSVIVAALRSALRDEDADGS